MVAGGMFSILYKALDVKSILLRFDLHFRQRAMLETYRLRGLLGKNLVSDLVTIRLGQWARAHIPPL